MGNTRFLLGARGPALRCLIFQLSLSMEVRKCRFLPIACPRSVGKLQSSYPSSNPEGPRRFRYHSFLWNSHLQDQVPTAQGSRFQDKHGCKDACITEPGPSGKHCLSQGEWEGLRSRLAPALRGRHHLGCEILSYQHTGGRGHKLLAKQAYWRREATGRKQLQLDSAEFCYRGMARLVCQGLGGQRIQQWG